MRHGFAPSFQGAFRRATRSSGVVLVYHPLGFGFLGYYFRPESGGDGDAYAHSSRHLSELEWRVCNPSEAWVGVYVRYHPRVYFVTLLGLGLMFCLRLL